MKLYLSSTLCWAFPVNDVIRIAKLLDFDGVEIWAEHVWHYETPLEAIRAAQEMNNIELSLHAASWDLNLCALNEGIRNQSVNQLEKSIQLADRLEATNITIHPGKCTLPGERPDRAEQLLVNQLSHLVKLTEELGVTLSLELMEPAEKEFVTTPEAINRLLEQLPSCIGTTFDIAHVPLHSRPEEYYRQLKRINKIHLSDATNSQYHVPLGTGDIELAAIMQEIEQTSLPVVIEGFDNQRSLSLLQQNSRFLQQYNLLRRKQVENLGHQ